MDKQQAVLTYSENTKKAMTKQKSSVKIMSQSSEKKPKNKPIYNNYHNVSIFLAVKLQLNVWQDCFFGSISTDLTRTKQIHHFNQHEKIINCFENV